MKPSIVTIGSIAIFALFTAWFFLTHERVPDTSYTGYQGEARFNRFLAAEMLLNELGIDAESQAILEPTEWLPDYSDTILTRLSAPIAVDDERIALQDWVAAGGHLIIMPPNNETVLVDNFLAEYGYEITQRAAPEEEDNDAENSDDDAESQDEEPVDYHLDLDYMWDRVAILDDTIASTTLSDDHGIVAARRTWGSGFVTVVSSVRFFSNGRLEDADHARLLLDVVAGYIEPGKVWLIYDASFAPLWQLIWNNAPFAVIGGTALLLIALWAAMPLFGPILFSDKPVRRSIIEHIRAAGTFVWKQHGSKDLNDSAARAILHEAEGRHPGISRLSKTKQAQLIARLTGLDAQAVLDAISSGGQSHMREFTQHMETLHKIRKEL
ncbi:MAG: hypothetical protein KJO82_15930 [Gammaproteobacteria bacterium]|nr:hypothetical protein [Gammaproteobacteria bacterium]